MSVVFQSKDPYYWVHHDLLFHVGVQPEFYVWSDVLKRNICFATEEEMSERAKLPAPDMVNRSYVFREGVDHNLLTLNTEAEITAMRDFASKSDGMIMELDTEGNEPAEPEGTPFISSIAGLVLTPAVYKGYTGAEGKTFRFTMGSDRNKYITTDPDEISVIRSYVRAYQNCGISDPTYVDPFA